MAYCLQCGAKLEEDDILCPFCGGETGGRGRMREISDSLTAGGRALLRTPDEAGDMDPYDIRDHKAAAVLAYFYLPLFWPLRLRKESEFAAFHAEQAIALLLAAVFGFGSVEVAGFALQFIPLVGEVVAALLKALWAVAAGGCWLLALCRVLRGMAKPLPVIGRFRIFHLLY